MFIFRVSSCDAKFKNLSHASADFVTKALLDKLFSLLLRNCAMKTCKGIGIVHHNNEHDSHLRHRVWSNRRTALLPGTQLYPGGLHPTLETWLDISSSTATPVAQAGCGHFTTVKPYAAWLQFAAFLAAQKEQELVNIFHVRVCKRHSTGCSTSLRSQNKYTVLTTFRMWKRMLYPLMISK